MRRLLIVLLTASVGYAQNAELDSLKRILPSTSGADRLRVLFVLSNRLEEIYPKEAIVYGEEGIQLARSLGDSTSLATMYSSAAFSSASLGNFEQSLKFGYASLETATLLQDRRLIASAHSTLGIAFVYTGQYSKALEHHLEALRLREELGLTDRVVRTLNNIGIVYHNIGQYDKAIDYFQRALRMRLASSDSLQVVRFMHNIGFSEQKRGNLDEAMRYHQTALGLARRSGYLAGIAYSMYNLGLIVGERGERTKAVEHLTEALHAYEKLGQRPGITQCLTALGAAYRKVGNRAAAIRHLERATTIAREIHAPQYLTEAYQQLYSIYEQSGPPSKAFHYFKQYAIAKDSLYSSRQSERIAGLTIGLEAMRRERELELLRREQIISNLTIDRERKNLQLLWIGVIALATTIIVLYLYTRIMRQKNAGLEQLNRELEERIGEVKTLSGLLPICANCKKIRDDSGYWSQLESFISSHSDARFTHGICPDCMKRLYPSMYKKKS